MKTLKALTPILIFTLGLIIGIQIQAYQTRTILNDQLNDIRHARPYTDGSLRWNDQDGNAHTLCMIGGSCELELSR